MVREVNGKTTMPYEKSRLVIQGYGDKENETILTQSPFTQRMSQRHIVTVPSGCRIPEHDDEIDLRTQVVHIR